MRQPSSILPPERRCRCVRPLRTVYALLEERGALALLDDPLMEVVSGNLRSGQCIQSTGLHEP